jgi:hypothetical protein
MPLDRVIQIAGLGQLGLALASTTFPFLLGWHRELSKVRPLLRSMFWIYAGYILACNTAFGLVSLLRPAWLLDGSGLATAVTGFITVYWGARFCLQFFAFDRRDIPSALGYRVGEAVIVVLVASFTAAFMTGFWTNLRG